MKTNDLLPGVAARLDILCERHGLSEHQRDQLATLLLGLAVGEFAPTTVREPEHAMDVHLADSLVALELSAVRAAERIADLGAGAGFPGLPLAVALPEGSVHLIESQTRKCRFMDGLCRAAGIGNARVIHARVEEWAEGIGANDVALARALAGQAVVVEYAAPLLRAGGLLVDWRGRRDSAEERVAAQAARQLGLELVEIRRVEPFEGARDHHLHLYLKAGETPARFPRRTGMARKRPLTR